MFKLEFDAANKDLAAAIGKALTEYAGGVPAQTPTVEPQPVIAENSDVEVLVEAPIVGPQSATDTTEHVSVTVENGVDAGSVFAGSDAAHGIVEGVDLAKSSTGAMIPWDARIHANSKAVNKDGSWKIRKGADRATTVPQVEQELLQVMVAPTPTVTEDVPPPPPADTPAPVTVENFAQLLPLVTAAKTAGNISDEDIINACAELQIPNFGSLAARPDLIQSFAQKVGV